MTHRLVSIPRQFPEVTGRTECLGMEAGCRYGRERVQARGEPHYLTGPVTAE